MLRVDRRQDMDELINFLARSGSYAEFYIKKIPRTHIGGTPLEQAVRLKWFYSLSHCNTFVGGKSALLSALLVSNIHYS